MRVDLDDRGRVRAEVALDVPATPSWVWGRMRDWRGFLRHDPLHVAVEPLSTPLPWADFVIRHRFLGVGPDRVGRIVRWREGEGFAISDLSARGVRVGFPHVCTYDVRPGLAGASSVTIGVRGVWTARWVPRLIVRAWIAYVLLATAAWTRLFFYAAK